MQPTALEQPGAARRNGSASGSSDDGGDPCIGAIIIVSFQSFGSVSYSDDHFAAQFEGWARAPMYSYLHWFGSSFAWLFVLPIGIIALMPARRLGDFGLGLEDWRFGVRASVGLYAIMLPVLAVASFRPNFIDYR